MVHMGVSLDPICVVHMAVSLQVKPSHCYGQWCLACWLEEQGSLEFGFIQFLELFLFSFPFKDSMSKLVITQVIDYLDTTISSFI